MLFADAVTYKGQMFREAGSNGRRSQENNTGSAFIQLNKQPPKIGVYTNLTFR